MGASNAWHHQKAGGFISVGMRSVGTSVAATVPRASMRPNMRRQQGIRSLPASSRVRIGNSTPSIIPGYSLSLKEMGYDASLMAIRAPRACSTRYTVEHDKPALL